ncbi:MAG TPA: D-glycero-beta-D-manno-heptose 1-phosphate adenylyltransferase [Flavobacteriales bacterium]|nr:D-glycero-beta-D-manno-heptose 1-phosphate adenylyltransferase [Flavobacteriales bacterium]HRP80704.1 D-glycero-beta-D-manno-heptose 1-phosphate adenylyltransferase [Flavobacteriales bacterium]
MNTPPAHITDLVTLQRLVHVWRLKSDRIVFTNGVFDILHRGHVQYLEQAAALGYRLVVGLNSDASVRRLGKGDDRPLNSEADRARVLAGLRCVDAVAVFDQDTPLELIQAIGPDVLAKGGDWAVEKIVGGEYVKHYGGEVVSIPLVEGLSTTALVERIRHGS